MQNANAPLNFSGVRVLALERSPQGLEIISQIFYGFGTKEIARCTSVDQAKRAASDSVFDLLLVEAAPKQGDGLDFIKWLRRDSHPQNRKIPVITISANGMLASVMNSRNSGSSFYLVKPLTPESVLSRVMYVIRDNRDFIVADEFVGPDRRVRFEGMPPGMEPRRESDITEELGKGDGKNMSQDDLDSMFRPQKVSLE